MATDTRAHGTAPPPGVAERLALLSSLYVPESVAEARLRLKAERPRATEAFEVEVARRMRELRALCDLAEHLKKARR